MNNLNQKFFLDDSITFLNHGSYGACPKPVFEDYQNWQRNLELQPVQFLTKEIWNALRNSRVSVSKLVGCHEDEVLFFNNPTSAIANVINSLQLNKGDEVLMTDHEYGALVRQWNLWGEKNNVKIIQQKIPVPVSSKEELVEEKKYSEVEAKKLANDLAKEYYEKGYRLGEQKTKEQLEKEIKHLLLN